MKNDPNVGLEPEKVRVAAHSSDWAMAYEVERARLEQALGDLVLEIQHVGSTAVPGLAAKPIIDIAIAIADDSVVERVAQKLTEIGYQFSLDAGSEGGLIFYREQVPPYRTHHVHVVGIADPQWRAYQRFRDLLRRDPALRSRYAELKTVLAKLYANDRPGYTSAKTEFVRSALSSGDGDKP